MGKGDIEVGVGTWRRGKGDMGMGGEHEKGNTGVGRRIWAKGIQG